MKISDIFEVFNKVLPWEWDDSETSDHHMTAYFQVDDADYNVEFESSMENQWGFDFGRSVGKNAPVSTITGTGKQYAVFSTVVDIVKDFIRQIDPDQLVFSAARDEPSRVKLYDRMVKMFPKDRYDINVSDVQDSSHYYITKKTDRQSAAQPSMPVPSGSRVV